MLGSSPLVVGIIHDGMCPGLACRLRVSVCFPPHMARRAPLVCQFIENLSSDALEVYADIIREIVGRRHGVYALYRRDRLYYVGLAIDLRNRLRAHLKDRHNGRWDRFSVYLTISDGHLKELESLVLRITQPKGNRNKGKFAKSENLLGVLRRRLKQQQKEEMLRMLGRKPSIAALKHKGKPDRSAPVLARYITRAMTVKVRYKKKDYRARVRKNGTIRWNGKVYQSPSLAAEAVRKRPTNGWHFWRYERAPGQWVKLSELRR